ncbi:hypothetical protein C0992_001885, partial [Termitomyces sp. T32_za158]
MSGSFSGTGGSGSPVKFPVSTGLETTIPELGALRKKMLASMKGLFLGPMSVQQFLDEFLPKAPSLTLSKTRTRSPVVKGDYFAHVMRDGIPENEMYKPY